MREFALGQQEVHPITQRLETEASVILHCPDSLNEWNFSIFTRVTVNFVLSGTQLDVATCPGTL